MELRKTALEENDEIMSTILKRLMCGIFGKFLTNSGNHADVRICSTRTDSQKLTARHNFSVIDSFDPRDSVPFLQYSECVSNTREL
jgi:hypothetical protein